VLQSLFLRILGTVSASSLPSSPRVHPEFRVFGSGGAGLSFHKPVSPLLHFDATSSVLHPRLPPSYRCPTSTAVHLRKAPRVSSMPFSISGSRNPSLHPRGRPVGLPHLPEGSHQGLATLSATVSVPQPVEASSSSLRSWASPSRAFLPTRDRRALSNPSLRSCVSSRNPYGLGSTPQRLPPTGGAVSLPAFRMINPDREPCSPGPFRPSRLSPWSNRLEKRLSFQVALSLFSSRSGCPL